MALNGATSVATLFSDATTATASPAVTLRNVGAAGGQAAAFTYDLARSVVYTRQGNPAWAGTERDGTGPVRSDDLFFGGAPGRLGRPRQGADPAGRRAAAAAGEPDHADEPRPDAAAAVLVPPARAAGGRGHDRRRSRHRRDARAVRRVRGPERSAAAPSRTGNASARRRTSIPARQCPARRATGRGGSSSRSTSTRAARTRATTRCGACGRIRRRGSGRTSASRRSGRTGRTASPGAAGPTTRSSSASRACGSTRTTTTGRARGCSASPACSPGRASRCGSRTPTDRSSTSTRPRRSSPTSGARRSRRRSASRSTSTRCSTARVGPEGFYGVFTANMHTDAANVPHPGAAAIVAAAQARGVPVVSAEQMLDWLDGRNGSSFRDVGFSGGRLRFSVAPAAGANGLAGHGARERGDRCADRADARRRSGRRDHAHREGHRLRGLPGRRRRVRGHIRERRRPPFPAGPAAEAARRPAPPASASAAAGREVRCARQGHAPQGPRLAPTGSCGCGCAARAARSAAGSTCGSAARGG